MQDRVHHCGMPAVTAVIPALIVTLLRIIINYKISAMDTATMDL